MYRIFWAFYLVLLQFKEIEAYVQACFFVVVAFCVVYNAVGLVYISIFYWAEKLLLLCCLSCAYHFVRTVAFYRQMTCSAGSLFLPICWFISFDCYNWRI